jgi:hypothetical protein
MITIVWRGIGILVPIIFFLSFFIARQFHEDLSFQNKAFVGLTFLIAAGISLVLGIFTFPRKKVDPVSGQVTRIKRHDFFYIPIIVWALLYGAVAAFFLLSDSSLFKPGVAKMERLTEKDMESRSRFDWRTVNFYNPTDDSISYGYASANDEEVYGEGWVLPGQVVSEALPADAYIFVTSDKKGKPLYSHIPSKENAANPSKYEVIPDSDIPGKNHYLRILKGATDDLMDYDDAWLVMDPTYNYLLLDLKDLYRKGENPEERIEKVDWENNIYGKYAGDDIIEPYAKPVFRDKELLLAVVEVLLPGQALPKNVHGENHDVLLPLPFKAGSKPNNEQIIQYLKKLGFDNGED